MRAVPPAALEHAAPSVPTSLTPAGVSPGSNHVRVTVERIDHPKSATKVGDYFDVVGSRLFLPDGQSFCPFALAAVLPVVVMRQGDLPADSWLVRKPWICGPDAEENLIIRVEAVYDEAVGAATPGAVGTGAAEHPEAHS